MKAFALPASLTIHNAAATAQAIEEHAAQHGLALDATNVETISAPGLQIIAVCWQQARQSEPEGGFTLLAPSEAMKEALRGAGMEYILG